MKTLIIAGTAKTNRVEKQPRVFGYEIKYAVTMFGQSNEHPLCVCFGAVELTTFVGYAELEDVCRARYAKYFETDLYNIISMTQLTILSDEQ